MKPDQGSPEAAFVLSVVDQQRRLGRPHGGQRRVVLTPEQVGGVLLDVPRVLRAFDPWDQGGVAGDRHGRRVGSYQGILRIYSPRAGTFTPAHLMIEVNLVDPILQLAIGAFVS